MVRPEGGVGLGRLRRRTRIRKTTSFTSSFTTSVTTGERGKGVLSLVVFEDALVSAELAAFWVSICAFVLVKPVK